MRKIPEPPEGWALRATCRNLGPSWFYAEVDQPYYGLPWVQVCQRCPTRAPCLAAALLGGENWGVWGGFTPSARFRLADLIADGAVTWEQVEATLAI